MIGNLPPSVLISWNARGVLIHWIVLPRITMHKRRVFSLVFGILAQLELMPFFSHEKGRIVW